MKGPRIPPDLDWTLTFRIKKDKRSRHKIDKQNASFLFRLVGKKLGREKNQWTMFTAVYHFFTITVMGHAYFYIDKYLERFRVIIMFNNKKIHLLAKLVYKT